MCSRREPYAACPRQLVEAPANRRVIGPHGTIPDQPARDVQHPTRAALAHAEGVLRPPHGRASMRWAYHFFSERFPQDLLVQRELRHELPELAILITQRLELAHLTQVTYGPTRCDAAAAHSSHVAYA